jgi:SsrA-binding protein
MKAEQVNIRNRRARFDYEITDTYVAGMVLTGTEIKSIRDGKASLADSYCLVENGEVWVKGMNISEYFYGSYNNHVARRDRKLLLNRKEIARIAKAVEDPGYTVIPLKVFISDRGYAKIQVWDGEKNNTTNARRYGNARTSARWTDSSRNDTTS